MADRQLDVQYTPLIVTTPTGVTPAAPQVTPVALGDVHLIAVLVRIPPGHCGLTGIIVRLGGKSIVPWGDVFMNGDNDNTSFAVGMEVDTGLTVVTYNAGTYSHSHHLKFEWRTIASVAAAGVAPPLTLLTADQLSA